MCYINDIQLITPHVYISCLGGGCFVRCMLHNTTTASFAQTQLLSGAQTLWQKACPTMASHL